MLSCAVGGLVDSRDRMVQWLARSTFAQGFPHGRSDWLRACWLNGCMSQLQT